MSSPVDVKTVKPSAPPSTEGGALEALAGAEHIRFVDGLRAVSILAVVGYHVGLAFLPGGFVGVDVFFVISGYLIIGQIVTALDKGFSFSEFWGRRAVRILPPYLLVVIACLAAAPFILSLPEQHSDFGRQVTYSAGMLVNHYFLAQAGYFDTSSDTKPLLHLWSLAVEEQFYLVAPLFLYGLWAGTRRISGRVARGVVAIGVPLLVAAVSLVLCARYTDSDTNLGFYVMPLRAWEFIAGGAVGFALPFARRLPRWSHEVLGVAGVLAVAYAVTRLSAGIAFPSYWAVIPVLGACAIFVAGLAQPGSLVARALATRPMVWLGQVSYAWYLWHWCALSFRWIYAFEQKSPWWDAGAALVALALATLTHYFVERPLRRRRHALTRGRGWRPALVGVGACLAVAGLGFGYVGYLTPKLASAASNKWAPVYDPIDRECRIDLAPSVHACLARKPGAPVGLLTGDSHSKAAYGTIERAAARHGALLIGIARGGCVPFFNTKWLGRSQERVERCKEEEDHAITNLEDPTMHLSFAVLAGLWRAYDEHLAYPSEERAAKDQRKIFVEKLNETLDLLRRRGAKRILVLGQIPTHSNSPPECIARADRRGVSRDEACATKRTRYLADRRVTHRWLTKALAKQADVRFIDPIDVFCDQELCRPFDDDAALYINGAHLSNAGVEKLYAAFEDDFEWVFGVRSKK